MGHEALCRECSPPLVARGCVVVRGGGLQRPIDGKHALRRVHPGGDGVVGGAERWGRRRGVSEEWERARSWAQAALGYNGCPLAS